MKIENMLSKLNLLDDLSDLTTKNKMIEELDYEKFKKFLILVNGVLREIPKSDRKISENMSVGLYMAPSLTVQEKVLKNTFEAIKTMSSNQLRAQLLYYVINDLHLFSDGNGRTARLFYNMLNEDSFTIYNHIEDIKWHDQKSMSNIDFTKEKGIDSITEVNKKAIVTLKKDLLINNKIINPNNKQIKLSLVKGLYIKDEIKKDLTDSELKQLFRFSKDRESNETTSALAFLSIISKKDNIGDWISKAENNSKKDTLLKDVFLMEPTIKNNKLMNSWNIEDYRLLFARKDEYKEKMLINIIRKYAALDKKINNFDKPDKETKTL